MAKQTTLRQAIAGLAGGGARAVLLRGLAYLCLAGLVLLLLRWPPPGAVRIELATARPVGLTPAATAATLPALRSPSTLLLLDINSATAAELEALPGIGPTLAGRIVAYRDEHGPYSTVEELRNVDGIGPKTLADLQPLVEVR